MVEIKTDATGTKIDSKFFELKAKIIDSGICTSCGTCIAICPGQCLEMQNLKPTMLPSTDDSILHNCIECNLCLQFCPRTEYNNEFVGKYKSKLNLGNTFAAKTKDSEIEAVCQDGGVVTSLLKFLFDENLIDGAIVSRAGEDWKPEPLVIQDVKELKTTSGTRYCVSPNLSVLNKEYLLEKLTLPYGNINQLRLAFVGTPCQVMALKKLQSFEKIKSLIFPSNLIKYSIGLFCMENFEYEKLIEDYIQKQQSISLNKVKKMNITRGKLLVNTGSEEQFSVKVKELDPYTRSGCHYCADFSNLYADISVGNVGSPDGYSTVIVRNAKGREIVDLAIEKGYLATQKLADENLESVRKLEEIKTKKAKSIG